MFPAFPPFCFVVPQSFCPIRDRCLIVRFCGKQVEEAGIQIQDPELRKLLSLTTADLRFADYVVKHVTENRDDVFLDGTGWEGGDEWIRAQFALYLHALLSSALQRGGATRFVDTSLCSAAGCDESIDSFFSR